jgi:hypothetical protein
VIARTFDWALSPLHVRALSTASAAGIAKAGLPERCTPHGLRKRCLTDLADEGKAIHQIQAVSGHLTSKEVARYTRMADRARNARAAMAGKVSKAKQGTGKCHTSHRVTLSKLEDRAKCSFSLEGQCHPSDWDDSRRSHHALTPGGRRHWGALAAARPGPALTSRRCLQAAIAFKAVAAEA